MHDSYIYCRTTTWCRLNVLQCSTGGRGWGQQELGVQRVGTLRELEEQSLANNNCCSQISN